MKASTLPPKTRVPKSATAKKLKPTVAESSKNQLMKRQLLQINEYSPQKAQVRSITPSTAKCESDLMSTARKTAVKDSGRSIVSGVPAIETVRSSTHQLGRSISTKNAASKLTNPVLKAKMKNVAASTTQLGTQNQTSRLRQVRAESTDSLPPVESYRSAQPLPQTQQNPATLNGATIVQHHNHYHGDYNNYNIKKKDKAKEKKKKVLKIPLHLLLYSDSPLQQQEVNQEYYTPQNASLKKSDRTASERRLSAKHSQIQRNAKNQTAMYRRNMDAPREHAKSDHDPEKDFEFKRNLQYQNFYPQVTDNEPFDSQSHISAQTPANKVAEVINAQQQVSNDGITGITLPSVNNTTKQQSDPKEQKQERISVQSSLKDQRFGGRVKTNVRGLFEIGSPSTKDALLDSSEMTDTIHGDKIMGSDDEEDEAIVQMYIQLVKNQRKPKVERPISSQSAKNDTRSNSAAEPKNIVEDIYSEAISVSSKKAERPHKLAPIESVKSNTSSTQKIQNLEKVSQCQSHRQIQRIGSNVGLYSDHTFQKKVIKGCMNAPLEQEHGSQNGSEDKRSNKSTQKASDNASPQGKINNIAPIRGDKRRALFKINRRNVVSAQNNCIQNSQDKQSIDNEDKAKPQSVLSQKDRRELSEFQSRQRISVERDIGISLTQVSHQKTETITQSNASALNLARGYSVDQHDKVLTVKVLNDPSQDILNQESTDDQEQRNKMDPVSVIQQQSSSQETKSNQKSEDIRQSFKLGVEIQESLNNSIFLQPVSDFYHLFNQANFNQKQDLKFDEIKYDDPETPKIGATKDNDRLENQLDSSFIQHDFKFDQKAHINAIQSEDRKLINELQSQPFELYNQSYDDSVDLHYQCGDMSALPLSPRSESFQQNSFIAIGDQTFHMENLIKDNIKHKSELIIDQLDPDQDLSEDFSSPQKSLETSMVSKQHENFSTVSQNASAAPNTQVQFTDVMDLISNIYEKDDEILKRKVRNSIKIKKEVRFHNEVDSMSQGSHCSQVQRTISRESIPEQEDSDSEEREERETGGILNQDQHGFMYLNFMFIDRNYIKAKEEDILFTFDRPTEAHKMAEEEQTKVDSLLGNKLSLLPLTKITKSPSSPRKDRKKSFISLESFTDLVSSPLKNEIPVLTMRKGRTDVPVAKKAAKKGKKVSFTDQDQENSGDSTPTAAIMKNEVKLDHSTKDILYWLKTGKKQIQQFKKLHNNRKINQLMNKESIQKRENGYAPQVNQRIKGMLFKKPGSTRQLNLQQSQTEKKPVVNSFQLVKTVSRRDLMKKLDTEDESDKLFLADALGEGIKKLFTRKRQITAVPKILNKPKKKEEKTENQKFLANLPSLKQLRNLMRQIAIEKTMLNTKQEWRYQALKKYMSLHPSQTSSKYQCIFENKVFKKSNLFQIEPIMILSGQNYVMFPIFQKFFEEIKQRLVTATYREYSVYVRHQVKLRNYFQKVVKWERSTAKHMQEPFDRVIQRNLQFLHLQTSGSIQNDISDVLLRRDQIKLLKENLLMKAPDNYPQQVINHLDKLMEIQARITLKRVGVQSQSGNASSTALKPEDFVRKTNYSQSQYQESLFYKISNTLWFINYRKGGPGKKWVQEKYMKQLYDKLAPIPKAYRYNRKVRSSRSGKTLETPFALSDEFGYKLSIMVQPGDEELYYFIKPDLAPAQPTNPSAMQILREGLKKIKNMKLNLPSGETLSSHSRDSGSARGKRERSGSFTQKDPNWEKFKKSINSDDKIESKDSNVMIKSNQQPLIGAKNKKNLAKASSLVFNIKKTNSQIQVIDEQSEQSSSSKNSSVLNILLQDTEKAEEEKNTSKLDEFSSNASDSDHSLQSRKVAKMMLEAKGSDRDSDFSDFGDLYGKNPGENMLKKNLGGKLLKMIRSVVPGAGQEDKFMKGGLNKSAESKSRCNSADRTEKPKQHYFGIIQKIGESFNKTDQLQRKIQEKTQNDDLVKPAIERQYFKDMDTYNSLPIEKKAIGKPKVITIIKHKIGPPRRGTITSCFDPGTSPKNSKVELLAPGKKTINGNGGLSTGGVSMIRVYSGVPAKKIIQETEIDPRIKHQQMLTELENQRVRDRIFQCLEDDDINAVIDFINRGADNVKAQDAYGNTMLNVAAQYGFYEICELLLKNGADTDTQNLEGNTALHYAVSYQYKTIVELLLENFAKESILNKKNLTCWQGI